MMDHKHQISSVNDVDAFDHPVFSSLRVPEVIDSSSNAITMKSSVIPIGEESPTLAHNAERSKSGGRAQGKSSTKARVDTANVHTDDVDTAADVAYSVFLTLDEVERYILEQEIAQTTKFILNRICKGFGTADAGIPVLCNTRLLLLLRVFTCLKLARNIFYRNLFL